VAEQAVVTGNKNQSELSDRQRKHAGVTKGRVKLQKKEKKEVLVKVEARTV